MMLEKLEKKRRGMKFNYRIKNQICILSIEVDILGEGVKDLYPYVDHLLENEHLKGFVFNLEKVEMIDSLGIGFFFSLFPCKHLSLYP